MLRLSIVLFSLVGVSLFITGCIYLSTDEFMPYHGDAVQMQWEDLDANFQGLLLGLIRGLGGGALVSGASILYMARAALATGSRPYRILLPAVAIGYTVLLGYATYTVFDRTPANPPLLLTGVLLAMSIGASIVLTVSQPVRDD